MIYVLRHCNHVGLLLNMAVDRFWNSDPQFRRNSMLFWSNGWATSGRCRDHHG